MDVSQGGITYSTCPQECRLRDLTYSAPIYLDVEYVKGNQRHTRKDVEIGKTIVIANFCAMLLSHCNSTMRMLLAILFMLVQATLTRAMILATIVITSQCACVHQFLSYKIFSYTVGFRI